MLNNATASPAPGRPKAGEHPLGGSDRVPEGRRAPSPRFIDATFLADPYPAYARLRAQGPLVYSDEFFGGAWLLTRHDDAEFVLRDARFSAQRTGGWVMDAAAGARDVRAELQGFQQLFARAMLFLDAPDHARIRRIIAAGLRPDLMQQLAPTIDALLDELLQRVDASAGFDAIACIARPLPARVIARLIGLPDVDDAQFTAWSDDLAAFIGAPQPTLADARGAQAALLAIARRFDMLLADVRRFGSGAAPAEGLAARLAGAVADGSLHDGPELLAQCAMLLFAGHETTRNLIGTLLWHLLSRPDLWQQLQREPQLIAGAVREALRYDSPVQYTGRRVAADLVLHGQQLRRGDLVIALLGAANRDPARFAEPDRFDAARRPLASMAFGAGPHVCIGAALTLVEAESLLRHLLRRWPNLALRDTAAAPQWNGNPLYRGLTRLELISPR